MKPGGRRRRSKAPFLNQQRAVIAGQAELINRPEGQASDTMAAVSRDRSAVREIRIEENPVVIPMHKELPNKKSVRG